MLAKCVLSVINYKELLLLPANGITLAIQVLLMLLVLAMLKVTDSVSSDDLY